MTKILTKEQRAANKQRIKEEVMKACIEEFRTSGDADTAAQKLSMAYLLMTMGNSYAEECVDLMYKHHIVRTKVKTTSNNLMQSFEAWNKEMSSMIGKPENANLFCNDTTLLTEILDTFLTDHITVERGPYYAPKLFLPEKK
jgi:hypothetical protein